MRASHLEWVFYSFICRLSRAAAELPVVMRLTDVFNSYHKHFEGTKGGENP